MEFVLRLIATMAGLWVSTLLVPSLEIAETASMTESLLVLAAIALVFTVVNSLVKPLVSFLAFPLYVLTFGLFAIVVNSAMFALTGWLSTSLGFPFRTGGFWSCFFGAVITAVVSSAVVAVLDTGDRRGGR